jgi:hypothetical protein
MASKKARVPDWWPPKGSSKQFRLEKWFWAAVLVPTAIWAEFFHKSWNSQGVLFVAILSVYALVKSAGGQEQAAEAKETAAGEAPPG